MFSTFKVIYLLTNNIPINILTKNLLRYKFKHFKSLLNLYNIKAKIKSIIKQL
jgi:hypothetical protein